MRSSVFIVCFSLLLLLQTCSGFDLRNVRQRRSNLETLEQKDKTTMDSIIEVTDSELVQEMEGVKLREGDIAVSTSNQRNCFARTCLWTGSVDGHVYIAYEMSNQYTDLDRISIEQGMKLIEKGTCIRFVPRSHERDYLDIQPRTGCWSYLGATGGQQTLSLQAPDCTNSGVVSHQLMHALGFLHEQSRIDRDQYITVLWANIWKDEVKNFEKFKLHDLDLPYDYASITHFGKYSFSEDGDPTIIPKRNRTIQLGQRSGPSELDVMKINRLYKCNLTAI